MRLVNKLDLDNPRGIAEHGSWAMAKNIQISENGTHTEVEDRLELKEIPELAEKEILGFIEVPDELILFVYDSSSTRVSIYRYDEILTFVAAIQDSRYAGKRVHGTYTYNYKGDLIITFGTISFDNAPEILIINCNEIVSWHLYIPNTTNYNKLLLHPNYFEGLPRIELEGIGAGTLDTGSYFLAMCYEDEDGNQSPFTSLSRPIILSNCLEQDYSAKQGNVAAGKLEFTFDDFVGDSFTIDTPTSVFLMPYNPYTQRWFGTFDIIKNSEYKGTLLFTNVTSIDDALEIIDVFNNENGGQGVQIGDNEYVKVEVTTEIEVISVEPNWDIVWRKYITSIKFSSTGGDGQYSIQVKYRNYQVDNFNFKILHDNNTITPNETNNAPTFDTEILDAIEPTPIKTNKILPTGKPSGKSLNIRVNNLSSSYSKIRLAILYYSQTTLADIKLTTAIEYNGGFATYNISNIHKYENTALENIIIDNSKYIRAKSIVSNANKLLLYNLEIPEIYFNEFQEVTNSISIDSRIKRFDARDNRYYYGDNINTFADTKNIFYFRPFKKGEVYCFYIGYKSKKGGWLSVNHIANYKEGFHDPTGIHITDNKYPSSIPGIGGKNMRFHKMPENNTTVEASNPTGQYLALVGITVTNVIIPDHLKEHCAGWEIFYAERTAENITRLGQGFMPIHKFGAKRPDCKSFTSFDLFYYKYPTSLIKSLRKIYEFNEDSFSAGNAFYNNTNYKANTNELMSIGEFEYVSGIDIDESDHTTLALNTPGIYEVIVNNDPKNIYSNILNQTLISTGIIRDSNQTISGREFGGDVFISRYSHRFTSKDQLHNMADGVGSTHPLNRSEIHQVVLESSFNYELRHEGDKYIEEEDDDGAKTISAYQLIHPQSSSSLVNRMPLDKGNYINDDLGNSYDLTYSKINNIENPLVNRDDKYETRFKTRIAISDVNSSELTKLGWRIFRPNNYYDVPFNRGEGIRLTSADRNLYIQNKYGLYLASVKDVLQLADGSQAWLGTGDLFDRPPQEVLFDKSGGIGCRDYYSAINTKFGYIVCDREKGAIYLVGQEVKDLTLNNFKNWFRNNTTVYNDNIISIGFDEDRKRLLINRRNNFTLSYSLMVDGATAFHDYNIKFITSNRLGSRFLNDGYISKFFNYPTGDVSYIDINITHEPFISKLFQSIIWRTEAITNSHIDYTKTIDKLMVYNDTQCTDILDIEYPEEWHNKTKGAYVSNAWFFNKLHDAVLDDKMPFLNNWMPNNNVNISAKDWFEMSQIISNFITVRLQSDNQTDHRIKFIELFVEAVNKNI